MIVRAHECVMDGFERFAQGHLITLFSATNYCGTAGNAGAILVLGRDLVMVPKLIHPLPPNTPQESRGGSAGYDNLQCCEAVKTLMHGLLFQLKINTYKTCPPCSLG